MKNTLKTIALKGALFAGMVLSLAGCNEKGTFTDARDGKTYKTVKIGSQTWMAENLNHETDESYCYKGDPSNCEKYGRLYTWEAARKACPVGWHLPDTTEWNLLGTFVANTLFDYNTDSVGYALKSTSGWGNAGGKSGNGSDAFGFDALPAGYRSSYGGFDDLLYSTYFWLSGWERRAGMIFGISYLEEIFFYGTLSSSSSKMYTFDRDSRDSKDFAQSVRCVKDH